LDSVLRFADFELDQRRAELRGPDGEAIRLRPKPFAMLQILAANAGRVVGKQELMDAVWPKVHVGEDSLFQCIREIRAALGDDRRQLIKVVSGRGYLFEAEVSNEPDRLTAPTEPAVSSNGLADEAGTGPGPEIKTERAKRWLFPFGMGGPAVVATVVGLCAVVGFAVATPIFAPDLIFERKPPAFAMMPIVDATNDPQTALMAVNVTDRLTDGLAKIGNIRVVAPRPGATSVSQQDARALSAHADFVVNGELQRGERSWSVQARMTSTATGEVRWVTSVAVNMENDDLALQQSRLAAGLGHALGVRINALLHSDGLAAGNAKIVIEQATAFINQTTRERFSEAQKMLENALAQDPDNVDLKVALAAHLLRGFQMSWYSAADRAAAEDNAQAMLQRALRANPGYLPALEGYCRFLVATNRFVESMVACAQTLTFDPWSGMALYNLGLAQLQLGRFEDALASFKQADRYDTPEVSRWTWLLGAGWTYMLMGRPEEALPWLQRSIAITSASGRIHLLVAVAYQQLGRPDEAKVNLAKLLELRPGSTARNISLPSKNASPSYLEANDRLVRAGVEIGLPEN
jgi:DNA-binding winged helix-turn-helix (wHTH) protein/tetratricopeptide (TPR) repeat protein